MEETSGVVVVNGTKQIDKITGYQKDGSDVIVYTEEGEFRIEGVDTDNFSFDSTTTLTLEIQNGEITDVLYSEQKGFDIAVLILVACTLFFITVLAYLISD